MGEGSEEGRGNGGGGGWRTRRISRRGGLREDQENKRQTQTGGSDGGPQRPGRAGGAGGPKQAGRAGGANGP